MVTVDVVLAAINLYQTSKCVPIASQPAGRPGVAVQLTIEPVIFEQVVAGVNVTAPAQSSFDGGGVYVMQIL